MLASYITHIFCCLMDGYLWSFFGSLLTCLQSPRCTPKTHVCTHMCAMPAITLMYPQIPVCTCVSGMYAITLVHPTNTCVHPCEWLTCNHPGAPPAQITVSTHVSGMPGITWMHPSNTCVHPWKWHSCNHLGAPPKHLCAPETPMCVHP